MEYTVKFKIELNEEEIQKNIEDRIEEMISEEISEQIRKIIVRKWYDENKPTHYFDKKITELLNVHKDEIVDAAGIRLAERLMRTKAVKNKVDEL